MVKTSDQPYKHIIHVYVYNHKMGAVVAVAVV